LTRRGTPYGSSQWTFANSYLDGPDFAKFLEADTARLLSVARKIKLST
jgi:hypothetical protein